MRIVFDSVAWLAIFETNTTASSANTLMVLTISLIKRIGAGTANIVLGLRS